MLGNYLLPARGPREFALGVPWSHNQMTAARYQGYRGPLGCGYVSPAYRSQTALGPAFLSASTSSSVGLLGTRPS